MLAVERNSTRRVFTPAATVAEGGMVLIAAEAVSAWAVMPVDMFATAGVLLPTEAVVIWTAVPTSRRSRVACTPRVV